MKHLETELKNLLSDRKDILVEIEEENGVVIELKELNRHYIVDQFKGADKEFALREGLNSMKEFRTIEDLVNYIKEEC